ncbi:unnamed protein product [Amoebophrya sp. A25]|nr:unnamed protein product [Amoebophrya sp. A25]|eukprot:GSA25T00012170001.1
MPVPGAYRIPPRQVGGSNTVDPFSLCPRNNDAAQYNVGFTKKRDLAEPQRMTQKQYRVYPLQEQQPAETPPNANFEDEERESPQDTSPSNYMDTMFSPPPGSAASGNTGTGRGSGRIGRGNNYSTSPPARPSNNVSSSASMQRRIEILRPANRAKVSPLLNNKKVSTPSSTTKTTSPVPGRGHQGSTDQPDGGMFNWPWMPKDPNQSKKKFLVVQPTKKSDNQHPLTQIYDRAPIAAPVGGCSVLSDEDNTLGTTSTPGKSTRNWNRSPVTQHQKSMPFTRKNISPTPRSAPADKIRMSYASPSGGAASNFPIQEDCSGTRRRSPYTPASDWDANDARDRRIMEERCNEVYDIDLVLPHQRVWGLLKAIFAVLCCLCGMIFTWLSRFGVKSIISKLSDTEKKRLRKCYEKSRTSSYSCMGIDEFCATDEQKQEKQIMEQNI